MKRLGLSFVLIFLFSPSFADAEITYPYTVDEKSQVIFGDSNEVVVIATTTSGVVATTTYRGLENYTQDYINGFAHFSFTYTHHQCCYASYPPIVYVTNVDPRSTSTPIDRYRRTITELPPNTWFWPTDWYVFDVQFDALGYTVLAKQKGIDEIWSIRADVPNIASTDWVSVANNHLYNHDPSVINSPQSMAFSPLPIKEVLPPILECCSNVLFLPGIEASRLYKIEENSENQLWEPNRNLDAEKLFMNVDGSSVDASIYTKDVINEAYIQTAGPNIYKSFLNILAVLKSENNITDYSAAPYDWRYSPDDVVKRGIKDEEKISYLNETNNPYIIQELNRLASTSQTGKVTIVAHSNGGLVTKALMQKLKNDNNPLLNKIDKIVFVAVPHLGTPSAIPALLNGYNQGITPFLDAYVARGLGQNLPGAYTLLPSDKYFTYIDNPVMQFDASLSSWADKFGDEIHSKELQHNFLIDMFERVESSNADTDSPSYLRESFLNNAELAHEVYDNWTPPDGVEMIDIAGWGIPTTISGVKYVKEKDKIKLYPTWTIDGDGTVVTPSALWANDYASTSRYWVNERLWNVDHPYVFIDPFSIYAKDHKSILDIFELNNFIKNNIILETSITLPTYISTTTPNGNNSNYLIYSLHSPLTLDIYDDAGNHTGVSTTTGQIEEQIPGTYFVKFGEEKYFFAGSDAPLHIVMNGYETGTFTFSIEEKQGDNTISTVTYKDIPTTPTTKVSMSVVGDINTLSPLNVDSDNNGTTDIILNPVIGAVVTYESPLIPVSQIKPPSGGSSRRTIQGIDTTVSTTSPVVSSTSSQTKFIPKQTIPTKATARVIKIKKANTQTAQAISANSKVTSMIGSLWGRAVGWLVSKFK